MLLLYFTCYKWAKYSKISYVQNLQLKEEILKVHKVPKDQMCLIYSGNILKDDETLSSSGKFT